MAMIKFNKDMWGDTPCVILFTMEIGEIFQKLLFRLKKL
jgi:hypothetical protein